MKPPNFHQNGQVKQGLDTSIGTQESYDASGLICLCAVAAAHLIPTNPALIAHQRHISGSLGEDEILLIAKDIGMKARPVGVDPTRLGKLPMPAVARMTGGSYFLVSKIANGHALCVDPGNPGRPIIIPVDEFIRQCGKRVILFKSLHSATAGVGGKFGLKWFMNAVIKYKAAFSEVFIAAFFVQLFALAAPLFSQVLIDKVLMHRNTSTLNVLAIGMAMIIVFETTLNGLKSYLTAHAAIRVDATLGSKIVQHMLRLPLRYFESRRVGDTVARIREIENIRQFIVGSSLNAVLDVLFILVFLAAMLCYSPMLTLAALATVPVLSLLTLVIRVLLRDRLNERFERGADNHSFLIEAVTGIHTLKALAVEPIMQMKWDNMLARYASSTFQSANLAGIGTALGQGVERAAALLILWLGADLVLKGQLTVGQLVAFEMLAARVIHPIVRVVELWQNFQQVGLSIERLGDLMNAPAEMAAVPARDTPFQIVGDVKIEDLRFQYRLETEEILKGISFHARPGTTVGIVGRSGSGKSTLAKVLQNLYPPLSGRIYIDGMDTRQMDVQLMRRKIGVVLQENFLFSGTLRENIALQVPNASHEAIVEVATLAGAHDFIMQLPEGYGTVVGERGMSLSGGQRQRVAIARALLAQPSILIFDEATSALDYESERVIQRNLHKICQGRTVFIIAHRLSTIRHADTILVLDQGLLAEQGTHEQLVAQGGLYASLYALQEQNRGQVV